MRHGRARAVSNGLIRVKPTRGEMIATPHDVLMLFRMHLPLRLVKNLNEEALYRTRTEPFHWTPELVLRKIIEDHYLRLEHEKGIRQSHEQQHEPYIKLT